MINKLRKILGLCNHKWETIEEGNFTEYGTYGVIRRSGKTYVLQCKECGNIKIKKV